MRGNHRKILPLFVIALLLVSILSGCGGGSSPAGPAAAKDIVIGVMTPTSGDNAYYGNDMYQSYQLAVKEINDAGGVLGRKLALYAADDG